MPRLLQINPVLRQSTSTGRIMREIGEKAMAEGWESYIAYSKGRDGLMESSSKTIPVGDKFDVALHGLATRMFDRHGLYSKRATREFLRRMDEINPDIIHIHNIHGYFLNYQLLFDYLAAHGKKVVWTVHDCWLYTGHCYYYNAADCFRWKTGCGHCPQRGEFPRSWARDRSAKNFEDKRRAFTSLAKGNFVIVPVSEWIRGEMSQSFLKDCDYKVIHNGIDLDVFAPADPAAARDRYGISEPKVYLGIASIWLKEKGLDDLRSIAAMLAPDERLVMVGKMAENDVKSLPANILHIPRTADVATLASLYSAASVMLNPTWQDNYPTVNLEAQACGTPVVTYLTGGSPESLTPDTGRVVAQGDVAGMLEAARSLAAGGDAVARACRSHALECFSKSDRYADYINLYHQLINGNLCL